MTYQKLTLIFALAFTYIFSFGQVAEIKVMTFNRLYTTSSTSAINAITAADADIVGMQETFGIATTVANALGFYKSNSASGSTVILSRWPITSSANHRATIELSPGQLIHVFTGHLQSYPYQPYDIRDGQLATEAQAIAAAQSARGTEAAQIVSEMTTFIATGVPVFLTGDFNEPSHLDWTQAAADSGLHFGMKVQWPASKAFTNAGMKDSYRTLYPNPIIKPGNTWSSFNPVNEVHDRIDIVYFAGTDVQVTGTQIVAQNLTEADIDAPNYASDHRAVVATFSLLPDTDVFVSDTVTICRGNTYTFGTQTLDSAGLYTELFQTVGGYDSTVTLTLFVNVAFNDTVTAHICHGDSYQLGLQTISSEGSYSEVFHTPEGCDSLVTLHLTVTEIDTVITQQSTQLIALDSTAAYQWLDCANSYAEINGANYQDYTATVNGDYAVQLSLNGCLDTSECYSIVMLGTSQNDFTSSFIFYPNPTLDYFNLRLENDIAENRKIEIYDALGRLVGEHIATLNAEMISIGDELGEGIYSFKILAGGKTKIFRGVKVK